MNGVGGMTNAVRALIATSLIVAAIAAGVASGTFATFTSQTTNPGNVSSNATLAMRNVAGTAVAGSNCSTETASGTCATLFNIQNFAPGNSSQNTATITYTGTVTTGDFRLFMANFNEFAPGYNATLCTTSHPGQQVQFQVKQGTAVIYPTAGTGFGSLGDFNTSFNTSTTGLRLKPSANADTGSAGAWPAANPAVTFTITLQLDISVDNTNQGCRSSFDLDWYASQSIATGTALATITGVSQPYEVTPNLAANRFYVSSYGSNSVLVYNATTYALIDTIPMTNATNMALNPTTNRLYVLQNGIGKVGVIDTNTDTVLAQVTGASSSVGGIVVDATTNTIYNANQSTQRVEIISGATNAVTTQTAPLGGALGKPAINTATHRLYVPNQSGGSLFVIDTTTNAVVATVVGTPSPQDVVVDVAANMVYVSTADAIRVVSGATNSVSTTIALPIGSSPNALALNPATHHLFVALMGTNQIAVIDTSSNTVIASFAAGASPNGFLQVLGGDRLVVPFNSGNTITVFAQ